MAACFLLARYEYGRHRRPALTGYLARPDAEYSEGGYSAYAADAALFSTLRDAAAAMRRHSPPVTKFAAKTDGFYLSIEEREETPSQAIDRHHRQQAAKALKKMLSNLRGVQ